MTASKDTFDLETLEALEEAESGWHPAFMDTAVGTTTAGEKPMQPPKPENPPIEPPKPAEPPQTPPPHKAPPAQPTTTPPPEVPAPDTPTRPDPS